MPHDLISLINIVFAEMKVTWGRKYATRFKTPDEVAATKRMWGKTLSRLGISHHQIRFALDKAIESKMAWPPELPEFLELCESPEVMGLPTLEQAYQQVIDRNGRNKFDDEYTWLHHIVCVVNSDVGQYVSQDSERVFKQRFKRAWDHAIAQFKRGKLPPIHSALPAPKKAAQSDGYDVNPNCPIQQRLKALQDAAHG
ncbi:MAG: hypothetical protein Alis3KO_00750 [Aliiglaciecola sp.]